MLREGRSSYSRNFRVQFTGRQGNEGEAGRLALIVSKRNAPRAVDRSRVRRLVREAWRYNQATWLGMDCVLRLVRPYDPAVEYADELARLLRRKR